MIMMIQNFVKHYPEYWKSYMIDPQYGAARADFLDIWLYIIMEVYILI